MAAAADEMGAAPAPHVAPAVPPSPRRFLAAAWAASLLVPVCRARPCMWALHTVVVDLGLGYRPCAYTPPTLLLLVCVVFPAVRHDSWWMIHQPANVTRQVTRSTRSARTAVSNASAAAAEVD